MIATWVRRDGCDGTGGFAEGGKAARLYHFLRSVSLLSVAEWVPMQKRHGGGIARASQPMKLLVFYIVFVVIGEAIAYAAGRTVEVWSPATSLPVFLSLFFFMLWGAWRLAVKVG